MKRTRLTITPEVIAALQGELDYVSTLQAQGRADNSDYGVTGQLVTLATYTRKAEDAWTNNPGEHEALHALRKVAAIAIRALIVYGCPRRGDAEVERQGRIANDARRAVNEMLKQAAFIKRHGLDSPREGWETLIVPKED